MTFPTTLGSAARPHGPGDPGYESATLSWNRRTEHRPAAVFTPRSATEVADAVRWARQRSLGVGVMATGHGVPPVGEDAVLVNTSRMRSVHVDPIGRTATVAAGARWCELLPESAGHDLTGVCGSSSRVGVVGFCQGGGFGWLSRALGWGSSSVRSAELVTADGRVRQVDLERDSHLLWAVAGGSGNFGVVTRLTVDLHRLDPVYAGSLYVPLERAAQVVDGYAQWHPEVPHDAMTALCFSGLPDAPTVPEPFRGRRFAIVRGCFPDARQGERFVERLRRRIGRVEMDTWTMRPAADLDGVSLDPIDPLPIVQRGETLTRLTDSAAEQLLDCVVPRVGSSVTMRELRQLGGALDVAPRGPHPMAATEGAFSVNCISLAPTRQLAQQTRQVQAELFDGLRPHLTGSTYLNFLDGVTTTERVRAAYTASDWHELTALKRRYDPDNVFRFNRNIPPSGGGTASPENGAAR